MIRFFRVWKLMKQLQEYKAFIALHVTNFKVEIEYWDGHTRMRGDEYSAKRTLRTLQENERRGLEWAEKPYRRSGPTVESSAE